MAELAIVVAFATRRGGHDLRCRPSAMTHSLVALQAGSPLPDVELWEGTPGDSVKITDLFKGKKGILFGVPGAFTPVCSSVDRGAVLGCSTVVPSHNLTTCFAAEPLARLRWRLRQADQGWSGSHRMCVC